MKLAVVVSLFLTSPVTVAGVFKCTGKDGSVTYQSRPCQSDTNQAKIKIRNRPANSAVTSAYTTDEPDKKIAPAVVLYSTSWCGYCKKVRKLFEANNIAYKEYDIEVSAEAKRQYDKLNGRGVPVTTIDGEVVSGYQPQKLLSLAKAH